MNQNNWGHPKNQALIAEIQGTDITALRGRRKKIKEILALTELTPIDKETLFALLEAERLRVDAREASARAAKVEKRFEDRVRAQRTRRLILLGATVRAAGLPETNRERLLAALLMVKRQLAGNDPQNPFPTLPQPYLDYAREILSKQKTKPQLQAKKLKP